MSNTSLSSLTSFVNFRSLKKMFWFLHRHLCQTVPTIQEKKKKPKKYLEKIYFWNICVTNALQRAFLFTGRKWTACKNDSFIRLCKLMSLFVETSFPSWNFGYLMSVGWHPKNEHLRQCEAKTTDTVKYLGLFAGPLQTYSNYRTQNWPLNSQ